MSEPTEAEAQEIIDSAAQQEMARIAGVPEPETTASAEPQLEVETQAEETQEVKEPSLAEQINEIRSENKQLRKLLDTTNGRLGQEVQFIKRRLDAPSQTAPNLNEVFSRINIEDPAFSELMEEFPDLAGQFVTAFSKALTRQDVEQKPAIESKPSDAGNETQWQETQLTELPTNNPALDRMALDTLQTKHPDFLELAHFSADELAPGMVSVKWKDKQFGDWLDTMPSDVREAILIGGSVETPSASQILRISDIMTEYKQHATDTSGDSTNEPEEIKREVKPRPKVDLRRTLMPEGRQTGKVSLTDEEIIEQAKQKEMRRILNGG